MNQTLHDTGNSGDSGTGEARLEAADKPRKSKRKPKRGLRLDAWSFILLLFALQSTQLGAAWTLHSASRAEMRDQGEELRAEMRGQRYEFRAETRELRTEMRAGFDRLDQRIVDVESGLRADMASMEDELRTEISGLRGDVTDLTERVARIEAVISETPEEENQFTALRRLPM